jgi:probable HAF family extracellular repeat protein
MTLRASFTLTAVGLVLSALAPRTHETLSAQASSYNVVDLGTLGGSRSLAYGINNRGQVVGVSETSSGELHAFLWNDGIMSDLGTFGGRTSYAYRIDDSGTVVGRAQNAAGLFRAFTARLGSLIDITPDTSTDPLPYAAAHAISRHGHVAGYGNRPGPHMSASNRKFLWNGGSSEELGGFGGETDVITAINESGQLAGSFSLEPHADYSNRRAFIVTSGNLVELGTLGGPVSLPIDMNNSGDVVGKSQVATGEFHGFLYTSGSLVDIGVLSGGRQSFAYGINNRGDVVGAADRGGRLRAVLYHNGALTDLNTLIPVSSGWVLNEARSISDSGQIAGSGVINGQEHAFLLSKK